MRMSIGHERGRRSVANGWRKASAASRAAVGGAAILLLSCGGGDSTDGPNAVGRERPAAVTPPPTFFPNVTIPTDANTRGMWSPVYNWPGVAVHAVVLPDGRVLTYGSTPAGIQTGHSNYDIWDSTVAPDAGHLNLPNGTGTDLFCSSNVLLPPDASTSPKVFIAGGDIWNGSATTNTANSNSNLLDVGTN